MVNEQQCCDRMYITKFEVAKKGYQTIVCAANETAFCWSISTEPKLHDDIMIIMIITARVDKRKEEQLLTK